MAICIEEGCNIKAVCRKRCENHYRAELRKINGEQIKNTRRNYYLKNKEKLSVKKKEYYQKNREKVLTQVKKYGKKNSKKLVEKRKLEKAEYYLKNKEKILKINKEYRDNNKEKEKQRHKRWGKENKEKKRAAWRRREATRRGNIVEKYSESEVLTKYGTDCYLCLKPINLNAPRKCGLSGWEYGLHIEHVIDIALGGSDTLANVRPSHAICNLTKKPREMV
jgi:hypothetical protein